MLIGSWPAMPGRLYLAASTRPLPGHPLLILALDAYQLIPGRPGKLILALGAYQLIPGRP